MKRQILLIVIMLLCLPAVANQVETIYQGPRDIGDWGAIELSSVKFHNLNLGDTVYVYVKNLKPDSKGAFQNHRYGNIAPDVINGAVITSDYEMIVNTQEKLDELKKYGLKVRGYSYVVDRIVIKHADDTVRTIIITAAVIILLVVVVAFAILLWKNRQLGKAYRQLYRLNLDYVAAADRERQMRAHYEGQIAAFKEMMQAANKKYQNSTLDDDEKILLTNRILKLFEQTDEIFSSDFSLNRLAELVGSNYKKVSQIINEEFGKNFNQLLNEYRIKEACRRLNDISNYGNYTIESIGQGVGFGSRSTFVTTFKRQTGLKPSEFQSQARNKD
jgi:AraC-like DNA-binding protein